MATDADVISNKLQLTPLRDHTYLFDVTSEASVDDLKAALAGFTIDSSYKVIGEKRYIFEINTIDTALLRDLTFPAGSVVTQYPVEHMSEALEMFGAGGGWDDFIDQTLPDTVLMFCDWQIKIPETHSLQSLESEIQAWAEQFKPAFSKLKPKGYPVIASIPPRFFFIASVEENVLQTIAEKGTAAMGGPGRGLFAVKRVVKI